MSTKTQQKTEPDEDHGYFDVSTFLEGLGRDSGGQPQFLTRLGEAFEQVVNAMRDVAIREGGEASGKVTVEFSLDLEGNMVLTTPKISTKSPSVSLRKSTAYIGPGGRLVEHDPKQLRITFTGGGISSQAAIKSAAPTATETKGGASGHEIKAPSK